LIPFYFIIHILIIVKNQYPVSSVFSVFVYIPLFLNFLWGVLNLKFELFYGYPFS
jgi:hypothetical protein